MSTPNRRELLAQQRQTEAKKAKRRRIIGVSLAIVALIIAIAVTVWLAVDASKKSSHKSESSQSGTSMTLTAEEAAYKVPNAQPDADAPVVEMFFDPQCPYCKIVETGLGEEFVRLAKEGKIVLKSRPLKFLDGSLRNDSSQRANEALACANDQGKYFEYLSVMMKNQPQEGLGYKDADLSDTYPKEAGLQEAELEQFQKCYNEDTHTQRVQAIDTANQKVMMEADATGTPTILINGKQFSWDKAFSLDESQNDFVPNPDKLWDLIQEAK